MARFRARLSPPTTGLTGTTALPGGAGGRLLAALASAEMLRDYGAELATPRGRQGAECAAAVRLASRWVGLAALQKMLLELCAVLDPAV